MTARWSNKHRAKVVRPDVDAFIADMAAVMRKHDMTLGCDDDSSGLVVKEFDEGNIRLLEAANVEAEPGRPARARRIAFCGHHGAGKDEAAQFVCRAYAGMTYGGPISRYLAAAVAEEMMVPLAALRGPDRHAYSEDFFRIGAEARDSDPACFIRQALAAGNVITGIRDPREIAWGRREREVDLFVWVDRPVPEDPTMRGYGADLCDVTIRNHGTLAEFHRTLTRWADFSGFVRLDRGTPPE